MSVQARLVGYPRIGSQRELKWALEKAWAGRSTREEFDERVRALRTSHVAEQRRLVGSAVDDFFLYDEVLETALMFGIVRPALRSTLESDPFSVVSELARGSAEHEAWEMTKWFDTNYHFVVPEVESQPAAFRPLPWREPLDDADVTWAILGPYSLVKLSKLRPDVDAREVAAALGRSLSAWVSAHPGMRLQLDEPCVGLLMSEADRRLLDAAYAGAAFLDHEPAAIVTVQFGYASEETVEFLGERGICVQLPLERAIELSGTRALQSQRELVVNVMDGRAVWPDPLDQAADKLASLATSGRPLSIVPSTSLMFLPYSTEGEDLDGTFWFAREKASALADCAARLRDGRKPEPVSGPTAEWPEPGDLVPRAPRSERRAMQDDLRLPPYPTTTTGSLPQTAAVRGLRARLDRGEIDLAAYQAAIDDLIRDAVAWQERIGLDVLVHGEFERTDMVEYFAAKMDGFETTRNGWVLSYGSRCVRPPILVRPPSISQPLTVREWKVAQAATDKPVKGMLTGPVTIVNWSFRPPGVPDDRLFWAVAQPIAAEVRNLIDAGCRVIQVDEPAVRERWPLPTPDAAERRAVYARGVRAALNYVFAQPAHVQMHTHMCYGDFGDIVPLWEDAGVDVASIEFSRSKDDSYIRQFYDLFRDGHLQIGPGVFDVHSPYSPGTSTMDERLEHFRQFMEARDLWVNPDCGLKTRRWDEIESQIADMVAAANLQRVQV